MCPSPVQNPIAADSVLLDDLLSGEVVVEGKSGVPIGKVVPGFLKTVIEDKNSTTISVETEENRAFTYRCDRKYDHFAYVMGEKNAPQASLESIQHQDVVFYEQFTSGGDPREFISSSDFRSGPPVRIRMHLALIPSSGVVLTRPIEQYPKKISWNDLESGRKRIIGKLDEQIGTVVGCRCRVANAVGNYAIVSTDKVKSIRFDANRIIFKKFGCVVDWKYLEKAKINEFDSVCYERVDCIGVPKGIREKIGLDDAAGDFRPFGFLVVKLPSDIDLPDFDMESIQR